MLVRCSNAVFIAHTSARLNNGFYTFSSAVIHHVAEREKCVRGQHQVTLKLLFSTLHSMFCSPDTVNLSPTNAKCLNTVRYNDSVRFYIFYHTLCKQQCFFLFRRRFCSRNRSEEHTSELKSREK